MDDLFLFFNRYEFFRAAHIGLENLGNEHGAVRLKVVLEEGDEHSRRGDNGVVEGVGEIFAVLAVNADFEAARLGVAEV